MYLDVPLVSMGLACTQIFLLLPQGYVSMYFSGYAYTQVSPLFEKKALNSHEIVHNVLKIGRISQ